jgi:hypothetical protein
MPLSHESEMKMSVDTLGRWPSKDMERWSSKCSVESAASRSTVASDTESATSRTTVSSDSEVYTETICAADVEAAILEWTRNAAARDIDGTTALYDPSGGRLVGTVDEATSIRRNTPEAIREYFVHFLGGHELVTPNLPKFDADDVIFLAEDVASYSGYYYFVLVKNGQPKKVHAKFTYIFRKTQGAVLIMTHNSGITPTGVVTDFVESN